MAKDEVGHASDDSRNPYAPPAVELGEQWGAGNSEFEAIRRAHRSDEAYVKAIVRWSLVPLITSVVQAYSYLRFTVRHVLGQMNVPWVTDPRFPVLLTLLLVSPILGVLGAYGLHRRKPWALRIETLFILGLLFFWLLRALSRPTHSPARAYFLDSLLFLMMAVPFFHLFALRNSVVLRSDYMRVMNATSYIRVKPKLPLSLKIVTAALALIFVAFFTVSRP